MNPFANQKILSEQFLKIQEMNNLVEKRRYDYRTYYHKNKAKYKQYYIDNKDRIKEYNRNYKTNGAKKVYKTKKNPGEKFVRDRSIKVNRGTFLVDLNFTQNRNSVSGLDTQSSPPPQSAPQSFPASVLAFFGLPLASVSPLVLREQEREQVQE